MICYDMLYVICYMLYVICYVMLCYVMLCYVMLCYVTLRYVMLCYVTLCYIMLRYVMLCFKVVAQPWPRFRLYQAGFKSLENDSLPIFFLCRSNSRSVAEDSYLYHWTFGKY